MIDDSKEFLKGCIERRIEELHSRLLSDGEKYKKITMEHSDLYEKIVGFLTEEKKSFMIEFDSKNSELSEIEYEFYYQHGFMDGFQIAKILYHGL
jgi:DNA replication initiation complex subunit (GINS family)